MPLTQISAHVLDSADMGLYERAKVATWDPKDIVGKNTRPEAVSDEELEFRWALSSNHVYAEQTGMIIAARLVQDSDDPATRLSFATATSDEARHAEAFARYAILVAGDVAPPVGTADNLCSELEALTDPYARIFIHTILEWMALDEFALLKQAFAGDLLGEIYAQVRRDEARHVAIGLQHLYRTAPSKGRDELTAIAEYGLNLVGLRSDEDDCSHERISTTFSYIENRLHLKRGDCVKYLMSRHRRRLSSIISFGRG
jgi:hypothetical protein